MRRLVSGCCGLMALLMLAGVCRGEPRRYALVVGVREYPASPDILDKLPYAEADATRLAATLEKTGYDVTLMTQSAAQGEDRQRFAPTATFLRREFATLVKTPFLKPEDCVLVTLAGHGIQLPSKTNPQQTGYFFCPADAQIAKLAFLEDVTDRHNLISVDELFATLKTCKAGVRLLVVDACRSDPSKPGAFRDVKSVTRPDVPVPPGGIAALFSCSANEKAVEDPTLQHGVFTHYLIEALSGQADTDKNGDLSISEIETYVGFRTFDFVRKKYGREQKPELTGQYQGWAAVASLSPVKPTPLPTPTPTPLPLPGLNKFAAGTKAGEVLTIGGIKLCWCPPGSFKMGSPASEPERLSHEDQVDVSLTKGFWLGQYEVTQAEYEAVMGKNPSYFNREKLTADSSRHPVEQVSWEEATEFCKKLTARERAANRLPADWEYTLPTEAQWEYACRAGTKTATAFGDKLDSTQANFDGNYPYNGAAKGDYKEQTVAVGGYKANAWELYDMHGNVWEWTRDWYVAKLPGGTNPEAVQTATNRVFRGGSWVSYGRYCRSAFRNDWTPGPRDYDLGFRLALVQP